MDKSGNDVTKHDRTVVLRSLIGDDGAVSAAGRSEPVLSRVRGRRGEAKEESLDGNDIRRID